MRSCCIIWSDDIANHAQNSHPVAFLIILIRAAGCEPDSPARRRRVTIQFPRVAACSQVSNRSNPASATLTIFPLKS